MTNENRIVTPFLEDREILGTWVFNETINVSSNDYGEFNINFSCNSLNFDSFKIENFKAVNQIIYLKNDNRTVAWGEDNPSNNGWFNNQYKTITITKVPNIEPIVPFFNWLKQNAIKQEGGVIMPNKVISLENLKTFKQECDKEYALKGEVGGTTVNVNPTLTGTETDLTGLEVNGTKYKVPNAEMTFSTETKTDGNDLKSITIGADVWNVCGSGSAGIAVVINLPNSATNGTLETSQLQTLQANDLNYIIFNNELYTLSDKTHTSDTLTYSHVGYENKKHMLKTISITVSTRAWVLNSTDITSMGATSVTINQPSTATNGTLTQEQINKLQANDLNYIIFANEIYSLNDKTHTADTLTYSHVGYENGKHLLKTISITVSTRAWVLNTTIVNQGGSAPSITELLGTWVFNNNINALQSANFNITFKSKYIIYDTLKWLNFDMQYHSEGHYSTLVFSRTDWINEQYKTIKITDVSKLTNRNEFETWLKANATKQETSSIPKLYYHVLEIQAIKREQTSAKYVYRATINFLSSENIKTTSLQELCTKYIEDTESKYLILLPSFIHFNNLVSKTEGTGPIFKARLIYLGYRLNVEYYTNEDINSFQYYSEYEFAPDDITDFSHWVVEI